MFDSTPLHLASEYGHTEITKLLLDNNASMVLKDRRNKTPLDIAEEKRHKKIIRMIKEKMVESYSSIQEQLLNSRACVICFNPRNGIFVLQPCGHAKTCEDCCKKIVTNSKVCPICRGNATQYQKIFY